LNHDRFTPPLKFMRLFGLRGAAVLTQSSRDRTTVTLNAGITSTKKAGTFVPALERLGVDQRRQ
jgi:hypothetical protein